MPKKEIKIIITDWNENHWYYDLPSDCKKILKVLVDNKPVEWRIAQFLVVDYFEKGKELKIIYEKRNKKTGN